MEITKLHHNEKNYSFLIYNSSRLQGFSQNEDLYGTWYLISYNYNQGSTYFVSNIEPSITPTLNLNESLDFEGEAACNGYAGIFTYEPLDDQLIVDSFIYTLSDCDYQSHWSFEADYFEYFDRNVSFEYEVYIDPIIDAYVLILSSPRGSLVYYDYPLGVSENQLSGIKLYPNPVSDILYIQSKSQNVNHATIFSVTGQKVMTQAETANGIDVTSLAKGIYFLEIISDKGRRVEKFIKE